MFIWLLPLIQLVPIPLAWWASLPGREYYTQALSQVSADKSLTGLHAVSMIPYATESAWLALYPLFAVFLVAVGLPTQRLEILIGVFLGVAACQAVLGLIQYGDGPGSIFYFGNSHMAGSATGTYVNRNHLAGLLEMALPLGLGLLAANVGYTGHHRRRHQRRKRTLRQRLVVLNTIRINRAMLYGTISVAILLGLIFTRSRAGVTLAILGILLSMLAFSRRLGGKNVYGLMGTFSAVGLSLATMIGLVPVLARFANQDPMGSRWPIFASTLHAIGEFFPLGSGAGTFAEVFHRFHPEEIKGVLIHRAHNEYLEWIMEDGLSVTVLLAIVVFFYLRQWPRVWHRGAWSTFRFAQVGAGIGLLLMGLHSLVDFNLHIPANGIYFAFLAAVFYHSYQEPREPKEDRDAQPPQATAISAPGQAPELPPENRVNPFAEL